MFGEGVEDGRGLLFGLSAIEECIETGMIGDFRVGGILGNRDVAKARAIVVLHLMPGDTEYPGAQGGVAAVVLHGAQSGEEGVLNEVVDILKARL